MTQAKLTPKKGKKGAKKHVLKKRALMVVQAEGVPPLYQFSLTGEEIELLADISRISRNQDGKLIGYQRPGARQHIAEIAEYFDGDRPLMPNPIILAMSPDMEFKSSRGPGTTDGYNTIGTIEIPIPKLGDPKPAWIVDGQQRTLALQKSSKTRLAVPVTAFIADSLELQREQFLLVNNSKPLPRGLVTELLPEVETTLPKRMAQRRVPAKICELLSIHPESPFFGLVKRPSMTKEERKTAVITDTSLIDMLKDSLSTTSGCLFSYRNIATNETEMDLIWDTLVLYWSVVKEVFPEAWGLPSTQSRLMHGVGIIAMGKVMDRVMSVINPRSRNARKLVRDDLLLIASDCRWISGHWDEDLNGLAWNDLSNIPSHRKLLSSHLQRLYLTAKRGA